MRHSARALKEEDVRIKDEIKSKMKNKISTNMQLISKDIGKFCNQLKSLVDGVKNSKLTLLGLQASQG